MSLQKASPTAAGAQKRVVSGEAREKLDPRFVLDRGNDVCCVRHVVGCERLSWSVTGIEEFTGTFETSVDVGRCIETDMANLSETVRQCMEKKATDELEGRDGNGSIVFCSKRNGGVGDGDEALVGDGDSANIAAQVRNDVGGRAEGCFNEDDAFWRNACDEVVPGASWRVDTA